MEAYGGSAGKGTSAKSDDLGSKPGATQWREVLLIFIHVHTYTHAHTQRKNKTILSNKKEKYFFQIFKHILVFKHINGFSSFPNPFILVLEWNPVFDPNMKCTKDMQN